MALRDLVADRGALAEARIEEIVSPFVRYDPAGYEIVMTPAGMALGNEPRILVYLVAVMGWQYVVDEPQAVDTRPAALEHVLGIPGGSLRPLLKKLRENHLLVVRDSQYSVRPANLDAVAKIVGGETFSVRSRRSATPATKATKAVTPDGAAPPEKRAKRGGGTSLVSSLIRLVDQGFFTDYKGLSAVMARLHELAVIAKLTSLSGPMADLVRNGKLIRQRQKVDGKEVWVYRTPEPQHA